MKSMCVCNSAYKGRKALTTNFRKLRKVFGLAIAAIGLSASIMSAQAVEYVAASGGTVTTRNVGGTIYNVHTFTSSGTFTVTNTSGGTVNYLVIGGGGGGGSGTGGGGGAGGFLESTATVTGGSTAYTVTVGTGGAGGTVNTAGSAGWGSTGNPSAFGAFATADGGGGGAPNSTTLAANGNAGGSGGGGSWGTPGVASTGGAATGTPSGQGNAGGACLAWGGPYAAGGGGGAGAVGVAGNKQNPGAAGGAGKASTITGTSTTYAGGGGGGAFDTTGGTGGTGGGGNGGNGGGGATAGAANKGSGGGGQGGNKTGAGAGGSGIVIISYASGTSPNPTSTSATLAVLENVATALAASNLDYYDPNSSALANVQITSLPALGTLYLSGTAVTNGNLPLTVATANITNLTYKSAVPTYGTGAAYTTIGIKVQNSNSLWSDPAVMTVNVTPTLPVLNGSFETPGAPNGTIWASIGSPWTHTGGPWGQVHRNTLSLPDNGGGTWVANFNDASIVITQPLGSHSFNAGDTLSVTFDVGRLNNSGGVFEAVFLVNGTPHSETFNSTAQGVNTWASFTLTKILPVAVSGNVTLKFSWVSGQVGELDKVSNISVTQSAIDPDAPSSANATLTVDEDTVSALTTNNFGYSDPHTNALAAVQITSLPALGTLKLSGTAVTNNEIVAVADINAGYLTYLAAMNANGSPYATIGIKVMNASNLWSLAAVMTVNVTPVNDAPTSTGGSVVLRKNTVKTFASANFPFSDIDVGNTLGAIKVVTSLPSYGTLKLNGTPITEVPSAEIPVASIGTLTYTPNTDYVGADSFKFQVRDATLFSADATLAITVSSDIVVLNGGFETPFVSSGWTTIGDNWVCNTSYGRIKWADLPIASPTWGGDRVANLNDPPNLPSWDGNLIWQSLGSQTFLKEDTLKLTFYVLRQTVGGVMRVSFLDGSNNVLVTQDFNTDGDTPNTWVLKTFSQKMMTAGTVADLKLQFKNISGKVAWLDNISNVSVTPEPPKGTVIILW